MVVFQGSPPWVSPTGWISPTVIVWLSRQRGGRALGDSRVGGCTDHVRPTPGSRSAAGNGQFHVAERFAISLAANSVSHSSKRSSPGEPDPLYPLRRLPRRFSEWDEAGRLLPPAFREARSVRSNRDRSCGETCPAFGRATPAQYVVMTKTLRQPYLSRPIRSSHDKPRSGCFLTLSFVRIFSSVE